MGETMTRLVREIAELPDSWHGAGTVGQKVVEALARHAGALAIEHSVETGTGRTTLLLSHLSRDHLVFTADDAGDGDSLDQVRTSPLLNTETTRFVVGQTQLTLREHAFGSPLQLAFLDGPHAYPFPELEYWSVYPHIEAGGLLVIDDIHIRTVGNMFRFLRADVMWDLLEVVDNTAFFRRTNAPTLSPLGDGWPDQAFNRRFTFAHLPLGRRVTATLRAAAPGSLKSAVKRVLGRSAAGQPR